MNGLSIDTTKFSEALGRIVRKYGDDVVETTRRLVKKAGAEARDKVKQASPKLTGDYSRGWTAGDYQWSALGASIKVYVKTADYRLTHLLEKGHAKRGGGRVRAFPHIEPVSEAVNKEFLDNLETEIKRI